MPEIVDNKIENSQDKSSYVTRGAIINCSLGSAPDVLNIPLCHGVYIKGKPQLNIGDSRGVINIKCFGTCSRAVPPPVCTPVINVDWSNQIDTKLLVEGKKALIQNATVSCVHGGIITIATNGYS